MGWDDLPMTTDSSPLLGSAPFKSTTLAGQRASLSISRGSKSTRKLFAGSVVFGFVIGVSILHLVFLQSSVKTADISHRASYSEEGARIFDHAKFSDSAREVIKLSANKATKRPAVLCIIQVDHQPELIATASESWLRFCHTSLQYGTKTSSSNEIIHQNNSSDTAHIITVPNTETDPGYLRLITVLKYARGIMNTAVANGTEDAAPQWFLLAEVCTFMVMSNLERMLSKMAPDQPHYLGHSSSGRGKGLSEAPWNQLLAGVVLSRGAVEGVLGTAGQKESESIASSTEHREDFILGQMLSAVGVAPTDTRDLQGHPRFLSVSVQQLFDPLQKVKSQQFWKDSWFRLHQEDVCCSSEVVSFRVHNKVDILYLEYAVNRLELKRPAAVSHPPT